VRVTASEIVGTEVLPVMLAEFRERHPRVDVELVLSNRPDDLLRREADLAVRNVRPTQNALVTRHIGTVRASLHAHPRYVEGHGMPSSVKDLDAHTIIGFDRAPSIRRPLDIGMALGRDRFGFRCDSDIGQYAALRAGLGVGLCQVPLARRDRLLAILPKLVGFDMDVWLAMHEDLRTSRRVRLLFDHLAARLGKYVAKLY
jgi:DNA-binding transcriptional LysR family regulator